MTRSRPKIPRQRDGKPLNFALTIVPRDTASTFYNARLISRFSTTASRIQSTSPSFCKSSSKLPTVTRRARDGSKKAAGLASSRPPDPLLRPHSARLPLLLEERYRAANGHTRIGEVGARIAAHFANAGVPSLLLDMVPPDADSAGRNKIAASGLEAARKAKPAAFYEPGLPAW